MIVEWISITDKTPDDGTNVLVTTEYAGKRYVTVAYSYGSFWLGADSHEVLLGDIVAWAALPEPATL